MSDAVESIHHATPSQGYVRSQRRTFNFWSQSRTLVAADAGIPLDIPSPRAAVGVAARALSMPTRSVVRAFVAGALPFDTDGTPRLRSYTAADPLPRSAQVAGGAALEVPRTLVEQPTAAHYMQAVDQAVREPAAAAVGELDHVIRVDRRRADRRHNEWLAHLDLALPSPPVSARR